MLFCLITAAGIIIADQISKLIALYFLPEVGESVNIISGVFSLQHVENRGALAGSFADQRWVFMIVSTIAIAVSSIVTTVIIILGVILIVPLSPLLENPVLQPAFDQLLPALFGALGVVFISKNWKIAIAPIALMLILFIFVPAINTSTVGIMVPVGVVFTLVVSRILYKKGVL